MIGVKIPSELTDVAIGQYITTVVSLLQLEINRRLQFWCKNPSQTCSRSKDKIPELWKGLYVKCCDLFYTEHIFDRIGIILLNFTPLRSPDIFCYYTLNSLTLF